MEMRMSKVLARLRRDQMASCFKVNLCDVRAAAIASMHGFDCIWLDMEHVPNDWSAVEHQVWAAKAYDADVMVRVSRGSYSDYIKALELDASGILVPHVKSRQDAMDIVQIVRFHPVGRRPIDGGNADGAFGAIGVKDYMEQSNERRFVAIQIEDPEALKDLDAIAAVKGIDMLFFGPGDLSQGLGIAGRFDHPDLVAAGDRIAKAARKNGKFAGTVAITKDVSPLVDAGYRFINMGADVAGLGEYCRELSARFQRAKQ